MINRVVLVGRLTRDPELRKTNSDKAVSVASFSIAVDSRTKNENGEWGTTFLNCSVFGNQADNVFKFTRKGSLVGVEGSLNQRNFVRKDGTKDSVIEVIADRVAFLERKDGGENIQDAGANSTGFEPQESGNNIDNLDLPDDSLPF